MPGPLETGAGVFPEEDLRDELVANGEPIVADLGDVLARFGVKASDRAAVAEIEEWFEELGMAVEPRLLDAGDAPQRVTLFMREWGPPDSPEASATGSNGASASAAAIDEAVRDDAPRDDAPRDDAPRDDAPIDDAAVDGPSVDDTSVDDTTVDDTTPLVAQLAAETGMPLAAAREVIGQFEPTSDFIAGLRERTPELEPAEKAAKRTRRRRTLRVASWVMFVAGGLLLLEAGITVLWQEPFSAIYSARAQAQLEDKLERVEDEERDREMAEKRRLLAAERRQERPGRRRVSRKRKSEARVASLADSFSRRVGEGKPLGEMSIPKIGMKQVMVQGTKPKTLRQGPGHYLGTLLPGQRGTVGIAGHRSTYSAPFKKLNELKKGDEVFVKLPYGLFTYRIEGTKIIKPNNIGAFRRAGYERLMLTACHPVFSDRERIIAWGRLEQILPRGAAVL